MGPIHWIFWGPSDCRPDKGSPSQKTSSPHHWHIRHPKSFTHLPDIARHVIAPVGTGSFWKACHISRSSDLKFTGIDIPSVEIVPPGPPAPIRSPCSLFPLFLIGELFPSPRRIGPSIIPTQPHHRLMRMIPFVFFPEERFSVVRLLDKPRVLSIGYWINVDIIII